MKEKITDFIIVPRSIFERGVFGKDEPYSKREAFLDLVQMAAFEPADYFVSGYKYKVERGQLAASKSFLSNRWHWNIDKVRRYLQYLRREGMCDYQCDHQCNQPITLISIANYDRYQGGATTNDTTDATTAATTSATTANTQDNNNKNKNNNKKKDSVIYSEEVEKLYALYPTICPKRNQRTGKGSKDKSTLDKLLKKYSYAQIESATNQYLAESYDKAYLKNFSTFLSDLPDLIKSAESPSLPFNGTTDEEGLTNGKFYPLDELMTHYGTHWHSVLMKIQQNDALCHALYNDGGLVRYNNGFVSKMDYSTQGR